MKQRTLAIALATLTMLSVGAYEIRLPENAIPAEKTAAGELKTFLDAMGFAEGGAPVIHLGQSPESARALAVDWANMRPDQILVREADGELYLAGARPRGTLYAVYEFLEHCGVRFWTSQVNAVPKLTELPYRGLNIDYAPPFLSRGTNTSDIVRNPSFAARTRNNGTGWGPGEEWGGSMGILGWCHTYNNLIPADGYFEQHPEWFSLVAGERRRNAQLCLSNAEMRKTLIENAANWVRGNPGVPILSVSQNDNGGGCECAECRKLDAQYGGPGGTNIWFVNQVAIELKKEFPELRIDTLAYLHTVTPPQNIVPADNVLVRLCFMGANSAQPLTDQANAKFLQALEGWGKCSRHLAVWNYAADFNNTLIPFPNIRNLGPDLRTLRDNGVVSIFEETTPHAWGTEDCSELRGYVVSKLMWNPDLDPQALIEEFVHGYYGDAAAPYILAALAEIDAELDRFPHPWAGIECATTAPWQTTASAVRVYDHMNAAIAATQDDSEHNARVRKTALSSRYAILTRYEATRWCNDQGAFAALDLNALLAETLAWSKEFGYEKMGDGFTARTQQLEAVVGASAKMALPKLCEGLPQRDFVVIPYTLFTIKCLGVWNRIVDDPAAALGKSVMFTGDYSTWLLEASPNVPDYADAWDIYAEVRCETPDPAVNALELSVYDWGTGTGLGSRMVPAKEIEGKEFTTVKVGRFRLTPTANVVFLPLQNNDMKIYADRVFAIRSPEKQ